VRARLFFHMAADYTPRAVHLPRQASSSSCMWFECQKLNSEAASFNSLPVCRRRTCSAAAKTNFPLTDYLRADGPGPHATEESSEAHAAALAEGKDEAAAEAAAIAVARAGGAGGAAAMEAVAGAAALATAAGAARQASEPAQRRQQQKQKKRRQAPPAGAAAAGESPSGGATSAGAAAGAGPSRDASWGGAEEGQPAAAAVEAQHSWSEDGAAVTGEQQLRRQPDSLAAGDIWSLIAAAAKGHAARDVWPLAAAAAGAAPHALLHCRSGQPL
jgi:hypothetical protein